MKLKKFLINNNEINGMKENYALKGISVYKVEIQSIFIVSFVYIETDIALLEKWKKINTVLSEYLEDFIEEETWRWNIYTIYLINTSITKELQYKIENDPYFSRKIVEENYKRELTDDEVEKLIEEHITFSDLKIENDSTKHKKYISSSYIYQSLKDIEKLKDEKILTILGSLEKDKSL
jgi:hypothetical protein